ncbi:MAG: tetratricopeptide repeat protein, partial [Ktedonobacteraceae bacterium]
LTGIVGLVSRLDDILSSSHPTQLVSNQNRQRLLARVLAYWITGVLEQSLHGAALLVLELSEQQDAIMNPWRLAVQEVDQPAQPLPTGTSILEVYDQTNGELLILGEPGSGKTTLLLQLARDLLERARLDDTHLMPVVFNLSSWAVKHQPLADWLIEELNTKYQIPRRLGQSWVDGDQILPLLDGLDEVVPASRMACVHAINAYRREHGVVPTVVCSRSAEYLALEERMLLRRAVIIQPLTKQQIDDYLASAGEKLAAVRNALRQDPALQELIATPLMLSVLTLAYQGSSVEDLLATGSTGTRRQQVFAAYVQRVLQRRGIETHYTTQQTLHWLSWLAWQMAQHSQTEFYIEQMQLDWLPTNLSSWLNHDTVVVLLVGLTNWLFYSLLLRDIVTGAFFGDLCAFLVGLIFMLRNFLDTSIKSAKIAARPWMRSILQRLGKFLRNKFTTGLFVGFFSGLFIGIPIGSRNGLSDGLSIGVFSGLLIGLITTLLVALDPEIKPTEIIIWSLMSIRRNLVKSLLVGLVVGGVVGLLSGLTSGLSGEPFVELLIGLVHGLIVGMFSGLLVGMVLSLTNGFANEMVDERNFMRRNRDIWYSARQGVLIGLLVGLFSWLVVELVYGQFPALFAKIANGLVLELIRSPFMLTGRGLQESLYGPFIGLSMGLAAGLYAGGAACVQHVALRLLLLLTGSIPWNYSRFLDHATQRILLRKVGGGYIFIHRLLLEYFATLYPAKLHPNPTDAKTYVNRGLAYKDLKELQRAIEDYNRAIELDSNNAIVYFNRGLAYLYLKNGHQAKADFDHCYELDSTDVNAVWMAAWTNMGMQRTAMETAEHLDRIAIIDPEHYVAYVCRGIGLGLRGKLKEGLREVEKAISIEPEEWDAYFWKGMLYAYYYRGRNQVKSARVLIEHSLEMGLPPLLLTPLYWLERDRRDVFVTHMKTLLEEH